MLLFDTTKRAADYPGRECANFTVWVPGTHNGSVVD